MVSQKIRNRKPDQLAGLAEAARDGEHGDGHHGDEGYGNAQPRQTFQTVFELDLVKNVAENGIVDGIPDLDDQKHQRNLPQGNTLHGKIG